jgi:hypothetical protein
MVTRVYKIKINYPDWLYRFRWSNIKNYANFIWNRPKCTCCGKKLNWAHPEVTYKFDNGNRLIVHWHSKKTFCRHCLAQAVLENVIKPSFGEDFYDYDTAPICQLNKCTSPSFKHFKIQFMNVDVDFRMCTLSWNHDNICLHCVSRTLRLGSESSSHWGMYKGESVPLNTFGIPIVDGKAKFPW